MSSLRTCTRRRAATALSTWSPTACPKLSLISLKPSRSMNMTAIGRCELSSWESDVVTVSMKSERLAICVSGS